MNRSSLPDVVITGIGVVAPLGIGREAFWKSIQQGRSGVTALSQFGASGLASPFGGQVSNFDPKRYVRPRKSLKVMSREIQFAFSAADLAWNDAGLAEAQVAPDRLGVVFGADMMYCELDDVVAAYRSCMVDGQFDFSRWGTQALSQMHPLWMLKYLPNMAACHIGIAHDARGPTNTITLADVSSLLAVAEGVRVIQRGAADMMIVGGTSTRLHPTFLVSRNGALLSRRSDNPAAASRPFDRDRDGMVNGEGAAALILESRPHATRREARIWAHVLGWSSRFEATSAGRPTRGRAIRDSICEALDQAGLDPHQLGHVNANGLGTVPHDQVEAQAIRATLGDVPVTAPKSFFGNLGAGTGAVELVASLLGLAEGEVPITLNYEHLDPECPVQVVHDRPQPSQHGTALVLNQATTGQAAAVVVAAPG